MLLVASVLVFLTGLAHSYLGERYLLIRLFRREQLPPLFGGTAFTHGTLRFAWHMTTVVWWGIACMLFVAARGPLSEDGVLLIIGATSLVSAGLPIYFTRGRHLSWVILLLVGFLALLARGSV